MSPARKRRSPPAGASGRSDGPRNAPVASEPAPESFRLVSEFEPTGDQPRAIRELVEGIQRGDPHQTLLGVTGSGKSFTIACVVEQLNRPTLVMAPNKTLAAQLYAEFKGLFPAAARCRAKEGAPNRGAALCLGPGGASPVETWSP